MALVWVYTWSRDMANDNKAFLNFCFTLCLWYNSAITKQAYGPRRSSGPPVRCAHNARAMLWIAQPIF